MTQAASISTGRLLAAFSSFGGGPTLPELKVRGKTAIVISHDDRYHSAADRLLRLEDGKLSTDRRSGADPASGL